MALASEQEGRQALPSTGTGGVGEGCPGRALGAVSPDARHPLLDHLEARERLRRLGPVLGRLARRGRREGIADLAADDGGTRLERRVEGRGRRGRQRRAVGEGRRLRALASEARCRLPGRERKPGRRRRLGCKGRGRPVSVPVGLVDVDLARERRTRAGDRRRLLWTGRGRLPRRLRRDRRPRTLLRRARQLGRRRWPEAGWHVAASPSLAWHERRKRDEGLSAQNPDETCPFKGDTPSRRGSALRALRLSCSTRRMSAWTLSSGRLGAMATCGWKAGAWVATGCLSGGTSNEAGAAASGSGDDGREEHGESSSSRTNDAHEKARAEDES
jgi:hypothetical protein